jgi:hypothetical protein
MMNYFNLKIFKFLKTIFQDSITVQYSLDTDVQKLHGTTQKLMFFHALAHLKWSNVKYQTAVNAAVQDG